MYTDTDTDHYRNPSRGHAVDRHAWIDALSTEGFHCRFDPEHPDQYAMEQGQAGPMRISNVEVAWQWLTPMPRRPSIGHDAHLFLKIVQRGSLSIEQNGQTRHLAAGEMVLVDPLRHFNEYFRERTQLSILHIPKEALRERGIRHSLYEACCPDRTSPDVNAVRDFALSIATQMHQASDALMARLGGQCLDLMDVLVGNRAASTAGHAAAATAFRAKQTIARLIGDPDLSVARIAAELHISTSSLTRALKANGLSPMRYAWSLRVEHAAQLLVQTPKCSIQEIAYQCGFVSTAHFSRAFKERYAMTPREFALDQSAAAASGDAM